MKKQQFLLGLRHGLPIGLGYLSVAFTFGIKAVGTGLTVFQAVMISMLNVTSAGQLAGLPIMTAGAPLIEMALTQLIINLRYALMSLSLSQKLDKSMGTLQRLIVSFCNTDEVFAVSSAQEGALGKHYLYGLIIAPYVGWSLGTLLGAAAGAILPETLCSALGIAIYAMFLAIIIPPAKANKAVRLVVVLAVALSVALRYLPLLSEISGGFSIIICAVVAAAVGAIFHPVKEAQP